MSPLDLPGKPLGSGSKKKTKCPKCKTVYKGKAPNPKSTPAKKVKVTCNNCKHEFEVKPDKSSS
jgi:predicted Zn finger-like uncharacterized protein